MSISFFIILLAPTLLALSSFVSLFQRSQRPQRVKQIASLSSLVGIATAVFAIVLWQLNGPTILEINGSGKFGLGLRLDGVSVIMFTMIAILSAVIIRYSNTYLEGDKAHGAFLGKLTAAIASVQLLVLSSNLILLLFAWIFTSISLQRLLIFYKDRPAALVASKKKFIMARISDIFLAIGVVLLHKEFNSVDLGYIFNELNALDLNNISSNILLAGIALAIAALFKSAQFPTHGWLIEVMETPTPVSALLHAGLLNAGPFLIIRFAALFEHAAGATYVMIIIGGITALFGSWVYITQSSVKTSLAYSSIAHMGFSLMICGFGAYAAAMLHLVAHSFYKAHAFLSSGSAIEQLRSTKPFAQVPRNNAFRPIASVIITFSIFTVLVWIFKLNIMENPAIAFISVLIILGTAQFINPTIGSASSPKLFARSFSLTLALVTAFIVLEKTSSILIADSIPLHSDISTIHYALMAVLTALFAVTIILQLYADRWLYSPRYKNIAIHLKRGFYVNLLFDKLIGSYKIHREFEIKDTKDHNRKWIPQAALDSRMESTNN